MTLDIRVSHFRFPQLHSDGMPDIQQGHINLSTDFFSAYRIRDDFTLALPVLGVLDEITQYWNFPKKADQGEVSCRKL